MKKLLQFIGCKSLTIVDKIRKTWDYENYDVAIDSVKGLGDFVEIEYYGKEQDADPKKITDEMIKFLKDVGCGHIERNYVGYPFQLLFPNEVKTEKQ